MRKLLRHLLLAAALLFSQHAAMLHGVAHAEHDVALAASGDGKAPALDHGSDQCVAFGALAHALGKVATTLLVAGVHPDAHISKFEIFAAGPRIAFDSRAPPLSA